jgi:translation initiation factor IF-2
MNKIRINELARELEVKANEILDRLPALGVTEKKTHSSSIDEDVAIKLRRLLTGESPEEFAEPEARAATPSGRPAASVEPSLAPALEVSPGGLAGQPGHAAIEEKTLEPAAGTTAPDRPAGRPSLPIRPPLAGSSPPGAQAHAPVAPRIAPAPSVFAPGRPTPPVARPVPPARPGQVLSGPRQPMPPGTSEPIAPSPSPSAPILTRPGVAARAPSAPISAGSPAPHMAPGTPIPSAPRPPARPLAGQPAARPIVPPRADLAARLNQPRAASPGMPAPAAPGRPFSPGIPRPQSAPAPGQPIYRGPLRPGQPAVARQGPGPGVRPGVPMRPGGGPRPMHPTSRRPGMEPAAAPPPPDQQRRPGSNRGRPQRDRSAEPEERILRPSTRRQTPSGPPPVSRAITVTEGITVKELSEKLDVKASMVIKKLMDRNILATINQTLDSKLATDMAREFGASTNTITYEEESQQTVKVSEEQKDLVKRAPVVTIMGHVDHGKTSLLDAIRVANVAGKEAGGITQHIGAYYVEKDGRKIVFIDTPGHEAFTRMRARGAKVTDIVVLVVAADDGVMPQTLEAIDHARAAKVPIVVAINKIDKPDAQPERIKQQLSDRGLLAEDWGGDTVMVPVSAKMKINLDLLLEMILLVADLQDLKANPARPAMGNVLEAKLDRGRGPVATVLVRNGTLHVGDYFICGAVFGKVRAMLNDRGEQIREAEPSTPVEVLGLESMPEAGDDFQVVTDTAKAKQIVLFREAKVREATLAKSSRITLEMLHKKLAAGEVTELPIILKADVGGSAEVLSDTLQKLSNDKVKIRVLRSGVGAINESDVLLASASDAIIIGFNVRPERNTSALAEQEKVDIRLHTIIYNLTDEIKRAMTGLLEPVFKEVYKGKAEVRDTFRITKVGNVAGCQVQDGSITRDSEVRLLRDNVVVYTGKISSLRRFKDDVSEVKSGMECGITLENFGDIKQNDVIEAFVTERVATEVFA